MSDRSSQNSLVKISPLQRYLREISAYPLLEPEQEFDLARQHFEEGDIEAAHRLVTANLRLVVKIASDFRQAQVNMLDLIQEGNYGLMQAVKRYNPYKGVKLSSYSAWWIRAYILKYIMENKSQVKIGTTAAQRKLFYNLKKKVNQLIENDLDVDPKVIAESLNVKESEVIEMQQRLAAPDASLDAPIGDDPAGSVRGDFISDKSEPIDEFLAHKEEEGIFKGHLKDFRKSLKGRDLEIFDLRFSQEKSMTLKAIGDKYGISRERARQLEAKIIGKLRKFVTDRGFTRD